MGDFIVLRSDDPVPADIVVLSTSDSDGACYVETKSLDGETNLKVRHALRCGQTIRSALDCEAASFWIESEGPAANLYSYSGVAKWYERDPTAPQAEAEEKAEPISIENLLLRGCNLKNTDWVIGVVVFTGAESKIMMNSGITPSKRSRITKSLNYYVPSSSSSLNFKLMYRSLSTLSFSSSCVWSLGLSPVSSRPKEQPQQTSSNSVQ